MQESLKNEDNILNLSDIDNHSAFLSLQETYKEHGELLDSFFRLFQVLGLDDESFIDKSMLKIFIKRPSYNNEQNSFNDDVNTLALKERSEIKLDASFYVHLSDAYTNFYACYYILNEAPKITSDDLTFTIESIDCIYSTLGRVYTHLMESDILIKKLSKKNIHSLGGVSRAKKYSIFKDEIFKEWERGSFYSYAECARKYSEKHKLSTKTIESWLSRKFSK